MNTNDMTIATLRRAYRSGELTPRELIGRLLDEAAVRGHDPAWITRLDAAALEPYLARLDNVPAQHLPLYGIPLPSRTTLTLMA